MTEAQIHDQFVAWLRKLEIPYIRHRMDRKSGIQSGWPDVTVLWMSRVMCIEIKTAKGRVTSAQQRVIDFIRRSGNRVEICRSCEECIEAVKNILCEGKLGEDVTAPTERPRFTKEFTELKRAVAEVPGNGTGECQHEWDESTGGAHPIGTTICVFCGTHKEDLSGRREIGPPSDSSLVRADTGTAAKMGLNVHPAQNTLTQNPLADRDGEGKSLPSFYIIDWKGAPYVVARDQDGAFRMIRQASGFDVMNLSKLPSGIEM